MNVYSRPVVVKIEENNKCMNSPQLSSFGTLWANHPGLYQTEECCGPKVTRSGHMTYDKPSFNKKVKTYACSNPCTFGLSPLTEDAGTGKAKSVFHWLT